MWFIPLCTFWALLIVAIRRASYRQSLRDKSQGDWLLDLSGLGVQGWVIPLLEIAIVYEGWKLVMPALEGQWQLHPVTTFALQFIGVDYLYYWNHRALHSSRLWSLHRVHHSLTQMDIWGTARNTLWSSFFIVYLWVNGTLFFFVSEKGSFLIAAALTAALDLWRHSSAGVQRPRWLPASLSAVFVMPEDHAKHHSSNLSMSNFGANFSLWDRLHGTWAPPHVAPKEMGIPCHLSVLRQLLWPFAHQKDVIKEK